MNCELPLSMLLKLRFIAHNALVYRMESLFFSLRNRFRSRPTVMPHWLCLDCFQPYAGVARSYVHECSFWRQKSFENEFCRSFLTPKRQLRRTWEDTLSIRGHQPGNMTYNTSLVANPFPSIALLCARVPGCLSGFFFQRNAKGLLHGRYPRQYRGRQPQLE